MWGAGERSPVSLPPGLHLPKVALVKCWPRRGRQRAVVAAVSSGLGWGALTLPRWLVGCPLPQGTGGMGPFPVLSNPQPPPNRAVSPGLSWGAKVRVMLGTGVGPHPTAPRHPPGQAGG